MSVRGPEPTFPRPFATYLADALAGATHLPATLRAWRRRRRVSPAWTAIVAVILFVLSIFLPDGRLVPAGLAFFAASFLVGALTL